MDNSNSIIIHQTLHGYSIGHTLLAASLELDSEIKRIMLPISDMSGSSMLKGFESYLTAYPLKDASLYAIARTWYAPEMKRPGCVYTQTLLIDFTDLPKVGDLFGLLSLFKRPSSEKVKISDYDKPLNYNVDSENDKKNTILLKHEYENVIKEILYNLYGYPDKSVFLKNSKPTVDYDIIFLLIWMQQWPRLRRNFSFCTGAIIPRTFGKELLDLQLVSLKLDSNLLSDNYVVSIDSQGDQALNLSIPEWVNLAFENLFSPSRTLVRYFNFFGSDLTAKRSSFKLLSETYLYFFENRPSLPDCIEFISVHFPSQKDGRSLKNSIFGFQGSLIKEILPKYNEASILYYLATTEKYSMFDYTKLEYYDRFVNFFSDLSEESIKLLKEILLKDINPAGEVSISDLVLKLDKNKDLKKIWEDEHLSYVFININPDFAYRKEFWIQNAKNHLELISGIQHFDEGRIEWVNIIKILIEINSPVDPAIFRGYDTDIQNLVLDFINADSKKVRLGKNWLSSLTPDLALKWFSLQDNFSIQVIEILVYIFNPNSKSVVGLGLKPWLSFIEKVNENNQEISIDVRSFLLSFGFNSRDENAKKIFEATLENVYFAIAFEQLNFYLWQNIEVHTKPLNMFKNWDKCKKLLNAVSDHYLKYRWDISSLINAIKSKELRDRMLIQYKKRR